MTNELDEQDVSAPKAPEASFPLQAECQPKAGASLPNAKNLAKNFPTNFPAFDGLAFVAFFCSATASPTWS